MIKFKTFLIENRLDFLYKNFLKDKEKSYEWKESVRGPNSQDHFRIISEVDPSRKKLYLQWILKQIMRTDREFLKHEDFYKVTEALKVFDKNKHLLENRKERDINYFKTYRDFIDLVDEKLICKKSGKEIKREEMQDALKQSQIIYKGSKGSIIMPKTENAACILGRGTKWCTSATDGDNKFNYYNQKGNLYIITLKNGDKYQFHIQEGQLMDARDREVDFERFDKKNPWVFDNIVFPEKEQLEAVSERSSAIKFIRNPSEKTQIEAVKYDASAIEYIKNPSEKVQMAAVKYDASAIRFIKNPSEKIQIEAVSNYGDGIEYIKNPSEKVQMAAVKYDAYSIKYIDNPTEKVQIEAVRINVYAIQYIKKPTEAVKKYVEEHKDE